MTLLATTTSSSTIASILVGKAANVPHSTQNPMAIFSTSNSTSEFRFGGPSVSAAEECQCSDLTVGEYSSVFAVYNFLMIIVLMPMVSVFGMWSNVVNLFIYTRPSMQTSANVYLAALGTSDFFVVLTGMFIFWIDSARSYLSGLKYAPYSIVYTLPVGYVAQTCSVYFTVFAAIDCYVNVCWTAFFDSWCTVRRSKQVVGCVVIGSILYNSLRFGQFRLHHCVHTNHTEESIEICPTEMFRQINLAYNVYMYMILMTFLPFLLLSILNALIMKRVNRARGILNATGNYMLKTMGMWSRASGIESTLGGQHLVTAVVEEGENGEDQQINTDISNQTTNFIGGTDMPNNNSNGSHIQSRTAVLRHQPPAAYHGQQQHTPVNPNVHESEEQEQPEGSSPTPTTTTTTPSSDDTTTMIMVVVLFLCCNTLALVVNIVETFFQLTSLTLNYMTDTSNFLVILNSSVNFVIYLIFSKDFRRIFHQVYFGCCCLFTARMNSNKEIRGGSAVGEGSVTTSVHVAHLSRTGRICSRLFCGGACFFGDSCCSYSSASLSTSGIVGQRKENPLLPHNGHNLYTNGGGSSSANYPIVGADGKKPKKKQKNKSHNHGYALVPHMDTASVSMPHAALQTSSFQAGRLASSASPSTALNGSQPPFSSNYHQNESENQSPSFYHPAENNSPYHFRTTSSGPPPELSLINTKPRSSNRLAAPFPCTTETTGSKNPLWAKQPSALSLQNNAAALHRHQPINHQFQNYIGSYNSWTPVQFKNNSNNPNDPYYSRIMQSRSGGLSSGNPTNRNGYFV